MSIIFDKRVVVIVACKWEKKSKRTTISYAMQKKRVLFQFYLCITQNEDDNL